MNLLISWNLLDEIFFFLLSGVPAVKQRHIDCKQYTYIHNGTDISHPSISAELLLCI